MHQRLIDFGLSEKETRVYLALLELGLTTVQEVASHSGVNRTTTYLAIESLKEHGLVSSYEEDNRSMLAAESPKRLADLIDDEVRIAQDKQRLASTFIPELLAMHRSDREKPVVRFFEGEEGLRSFRSAVAEVRTKQFDTFVRLNERFEVIAKTDEEKRLQTIKPLVRYRLIYVPDAGVSIPRFPEEAEGRIEIRYANDIPFDFDGAVGILDRMSYIVSLKPRIQISVIESEQLSNLMRAQFELMWGCATVERVNFVV